MAVGIGWPPKYQKVIFFDCIRIDILYIVAN